MQNFVQLIEQQVISLICTLKLLGFVFRYHTLVQFTCRNFLKGELLAGIFLFVGNFPLQELFFWELSPPPPPPVISNGPPLIHLIQPIKLPITDDARKQ